MTAGSTPLASLDTVTWLQLRRYTDNGHLVVVEGGKDIPFPIARIFYIYGTSEVALRGDHAHLNCRQILVCLNGRIDVICDDGTRKQTFQLTDPSSALYVPPTIWAAERFLTRDAVLLVFADLPYAETDYIRDYADYQRYRRGQT
jgi:WxcM-like, C-terminal